MFMTNNRTTSITTSITTSAVSNTHKLSEGGGEGGEGGEGSGLQTATVMAMVMVGTALYCTHARANHACRGHNLRTTQYIVPGTDAVDGVAYERVGQRAFASVDIVAGAEVLNCYLVEPSTMEKKERREALQQYLFKCDCGLCEEEASASESDYESDAGADADY